MVANEIGPIYHLRIVYLAPATVIHGLFRGLNSATEIVRSTQAPPLLAVEERPKQPCGRWLINDLVAGFCFCQWQQTFRMPAERASERTVSNRPTQSRPLTAQLGRLNLA